MHLRKGLIPLAQRPDASDKRGYVQLSGGNQFDDGFPVRPRVAEASLKPDVLFERAGQERIQAGQAPIRLS